MQTPGDCPRCGSSRVSVSNDETYAHCRPCGEEWGLSPGDGEA